MDYAEPELRPDVSKSFYEQGQHRPYFDLLPTKEQYDTCYTFGFGSRSYPGQHGVGFCESAKAALKQINSLRHSDEEIHYIRAPGGRRIEEWDLKERAEKEASA